MYYDPAATGERIQNLRKDREVTQEQLAVDLNISDRYMRNLEKGRKFRLLTSLWNCGSGSVPRWTISFWACLHHSGSKSCKISCKCSAKN